FRSSGRPARRGRRPGGRQMGRDALRLRRDEARLRGDRRRTDRMVPGAARALQVPAYDRLRRNPEDLDRQGAEIHPARAGEAARPGSGLGPMRDNAWPRCCRALLMGSVTAAARQFPGRGEQAPERVHRVRKTLKEARAVTRLFLPCLGEPARVTIAALAVVRRRVGRARDLDVMEARLQRLAPPAEIAKPLGEAKALAQGIGGRVKASLDKALKLEPNHADAHIALGAYHAEIVTKVGGMLASLTYGASKEEAMKHFALARRLLPDSAIARIEEANGIVMLFGKAKLAEAEKLYKEAARCKPADAMQKLDAASDPDVAGLSRGRNRRSRTEDAHDRGARQAARHSARLAHLTLAGESLHAPVRARMEDVRARANPRHAARDLRRRPRDPVQKGQRRRSLAATARDHGQAEADGERGEDTDLQSAGGASST